MERAGAEAKAKAVQEAAAAAPSQAAEQPGQQPDDPIEQDPIAEVVAAGGEKHKLEDVFLRWGAKIKRPRVSA